MQVIRGHVLTELGGAPTDPLHGITYSVQCVLMYCGIEKSDSYKWIRCIDSPLIDFFRVIGFHTGRWSGRDVVPECFSVPECF